MRCGTRDDFLPLWQDRPHAVGKAVITEAYFHLICSPTLLVFLETQLVQGKEISQSLSYLVAKLRL